MKTSGSITVDRPIEEVFSYTNGHVAEWSLTVIEDRPTNEIEGLGATFDCVTEDHGCKMDFDGEVTVWEPPHRSSIEMVGKQFDIHAEYLFESTDSGTRVTQNSVVLPKGFMKIVMFFIGWLMAKQGCDAVQKELASLKEKLEQ
ncbi:MAG: SRPBCC family protein [Rubripirellula sp.]|nr:SRPBCC family protein [Rubripirellula sp.]